MSTVARKFVGMLRHFVLSLEKSIGNKARMPHSTKQDPIMQLPKEIEVLASKNLAEKTLRMVA